MKWLRTDHSAEILVYVWYYALLEKKKTLTV